MSDTATNTDYLWGARAIADEINRPTKDVYYLLEKGELPARKIRGQWCASRLKLRHHLIGE